MKYFFVDTETTGVDFRTNGIWQMAGQIWVDGREVERFGFTMQPLKGKLVHNEALAKGGVTMEQLRRFELPHARYHALKKILGRHCDKFDRTDKMWFVGYNAQFDCQFMRQWFEDMGDKYFGSWFWYPFIDIAQLAGFCLMRRRVQMENFRLGTVCRHMGVEFREDDAHDAQYDVDKARQLFDRLVETGLVVLPADPTQ